MAKAKDITGQRFGRLVAVKRSEQKSRNGTAFWECVCDCGGKINLRLDQLTTGKARSCGCLFKESVSENGKLNSLDLTGKKFDKLTVVKKTNKRNFNNCIVWECVCDCGEKTEVASANLLAGKIRSCGCIAKENGTKECVENTNLNKLNSIPQKNNTSGRKGVTKVGEYWKAYIGFQKRIIYLGTYKKFEDAVKARARAEEEYFEPMLNKYGKEWKGE